MKKLFSVFLAIIMVFSATAVAYAQPEEISEYPVIIVPGYSAGQLKRIYEDGSAERVWDADFAKAGDMLLEDAAQLVASLGGISQGNYKMVAKILGEGLSELLDDVKCNPDGTSKYNIEVILPNTAEGNRWSTLPEELKSEPDIVGELINYVDADDVYNFHCDFRMGAVECANQLNDLITDVIETTGSEKVNIFAISHGGQVTGTYLSLYGTQGYVNNCVMFMPAMGGAALAYDVMSNSIRIDEKVLLRFLEFAFRLEDDWHWLVEAEKMGFLDDFIEEIVPYVHQVLGYWGSIWDFIPLDYFDEMITMLDPVESALLIEKTTWYHENIMPSYAENLNAAKASGVNISIITGTGYPAVTGLQENSDAIIRTTDTCGALCAPWGQRFADGYTVAGTSCNDLSHNHLSPSMEIDASTCWLPENTWFVDGLFHGMQYWDNYTRELLYMQLISVNPLEDVHASSEFTQFHAHSNCSEAVHLKFNSSPEGYVSSADNSVIIKNTTTDSVVDVYDITAEGLDIEFEEFDIKTIKPGEEIEITFTADIPDISVVRAAVTVYCVAYGAVTPVSARTFDFTVMNGEKAAYDSSEPYADADYVREYDKGIYSELIDMFERLLKKAIEIISYFARIFKEMSVW